LFLDPYPSSLRYGLAREDSDTAKLLTDFKPGLITRFPFLFMRAVPGSYLYSDKSPKEILLNVVYLLFGLSFLLVLTLEAPVLFW